MICLISKKTVIVIRRSSVFWDVRLRFKLKVKYSTCRFFPPFVGVSVCDLSGAGCNVS